MRQIIDKLSPSQIDEGVIDSIRQWIQDLSAPVKSAGQELVNNLQSQLASRYNGQVAPQIKVANPSWMWGRLTYKNLYSFATKVVGVSDEELDKMLKTPIVNNNLKLIFKMPTKDKASTMSLPLQSSIIKNNNEYITSTVDPQTKQYLSKAIATAVLDGLAYIVQERKDQEERDSQRADEPQSIPDRSKYGIEDEPQSIPDRSKYGIEDEPEEPVMPGVPTSHQDILAALQTIKQGLAKAKGAA